MTTPCRHWSESQNLSTWWDKLWGASILIGNGGWTNIEKSLRAVGGGWKGDGSGEWLTKSIVQSLESQRRLPGGGNILSSKWGEKAGYKERGEAGQSRMKLSPARTRCIHIMGRWPEYVDRRVPCAVEGEVGQELIREGFVARIRRLGFYSMRHRKPLEGFKQEQHDLVYLLKSSIEMLSIIRKCKSKS